jgi:hypothetical protein
LIFILMFTGTGTKYLVYVSVRIQKQINYIFGPKIKLGTVTGNFFVISSVDMAINKIDNT